ncbi:LOW QUALITY PROTEIN: Transcription factor GRAS [Dillenia turbinata]|uniref:Transcription factor GRAS n=1 Tax=Dillenia turbinata TaxID=194707 RepID=A0AAN8VCT9_9MAGN
MKDIKEDLFNIEAGEVIAIYSQFYISSLIAHPDSEEALKQENHSERMILEKVVYTEGIRNVVAMEGVERRVRFVTINVWRKMFIEFGMQNSARPHLYQATLVPKNSACGNSYTLKMDNKCLVIGWKGTLTHSAPAWKFL